MSAFLSQNDTGRRRLHAGRRGVAVRGACQHRLRPHAMEAQPIEARGRDRDSASHVGSACAKPFEATLQRIEASAPLSDGDQVRLSIGGPRNGYVYVIASRTAPY
jgi:hypothetical protein